MGRNGRNGTRNQSLDDGPPLECLFGELRFTKTSPRRHQDCTALGATPPRLIDLLGVRPGPLGTLDKIVMRARRGRRDCDQKVQQAATGTTSSRSTPRQPHPRPACCVPPPGGCLTSVLLRCRDAGEYPRYLRRTIGSSGCPCPPSPRSE